MDPSEMNWQSVISDPTDINLGYLPHPRDNILQNRSYFLSPRDPPYGLLIMTMHLLETWKRRWPEHLATNILDFLDSNNYKAIMFPHLNEVFSDRIDHFMDARNGEPVSRCKDEFPVYGLGLRADSHEFQCWIKHQQEPPTDPTVRRSMVCFHVFGRMHVYAGIGSGTYGSVDVAREPDPNSALYKYYAVKVEAHRTMRNREHNRALNPTMTAIQDNDGKYRYIPYEALLLLLTSGNDRFPTLDSVYTEDELHSILMSVCVDHDILQIEPDELENGRVIAFTGRFLSYEKEPILNELEACKVASQLLEGCVYLRDMSLSHGDLSRLNYIVDENLNATLIDLGMTYFAPDDVAASAEYWSHIDAMEHLITPELAVELSKQRWRQIDRNENQVDVYLPHKAPAAHLWRFAALTYDMLHGFGPWESPEWNPNLGHVDWYSRTDARWDMVYERRDRVINEELPVDEGLSQDCVDALRMMLAKEPTERATLAETCSLPWFGQYAYHTDTLFVRPDSKGYREAKLDKGIPI